MRARIVAILILLCFPILSNCWLGHPLMGEYGPAADTNEDGELSVEELITFTLLATNTELSIHYPGSPFILHDGDATTITPVITGTVTGCSSNPSPLQSPLGNGFMGLTLSSDCVISGVTTSNTNPLDSYIITATNSSTSANTTIEIQLICDIC